MMRRFWQSFRPPSRQQRQAIVAKFPAERAQQAALGIAARVIVQIIALVSWPLVIYDYLKKHASLRSAIFWAAFIAVAIYLGFGTAALLGIVSMALRFAMAAFYMIFQFIVLFSFLSSTKTLEVYPGDERVVTFEKDYFGQAYLVNAVRQWVSSLTLEGKKKLDAMGAEAISGLLLEGQPGSGKTWLAQCLAGDSGGAFFGLSGTDFTNMFFGVSEMKVIGVYRKARKAARRYGSSIVFIDEFDSIAARRGGVTGDKSQPAVTGGMFSGGLGVSSKLLVELDGARTIGRRDQLQNGMRRWFGIPEIIQGLVLTVGATNRLVAIDPAFLRPGRMDKILRVDPPDRASRRAIIEGYLRKVKNDGQVDINHLTEDTAGVTPAKIMSTIQRSAPRYAINAGRDYITEADILHALQEDLIGLANPIADFAPEQRQQVAYHEAGHAVASFLLLPERRITHVSIIRRGTGILGYVQGAETTEIYAEPLSKLSARVMVALAGHEAVRLALGEPWSGASADFDAVRAYIAAMANMGQFGGIPFSVTGGGPLEQKYIAENADKWLKDAQEQTYKLLEKHRPKLEAVAQALIAEDELSSARVYEILKGGVS